MGGKRSVQPEGFVSFSFVVGGGTKFGVTTCKTCFKNGRLVKLAGCSHMRDQFLHRRHRRRLFIKDDKCMATIISILES